MQLTDSVSRLALADRHYGNIIGTTIRRCAGPGNPCINILKFDV
jgi:hypothetical protein